MEVFIERLSHRQDEQWSEKDLEQLRLLSRDPEQAKALWESQSAFSHLCELSQVGARKALANCLFHLPVARQVMARGTGGLLNGLLGDLPMTVQVRREDDYVALRLLFLLTVETEGARLVLNHGYNDLLQISLAIDDEGRSGLGRAGIIEVLRILYNVTRLEGPARSARREEGEEDEKEEEKKRTNISSLGAFIYRGLGSDDGEVIGNTFNLLLNRPTCLLWAGPEEERSRDDLADVLVLALSRVTAPEMGTEYVPTACLALTQLVEADDALRSSLRRRILPSSFCRARSIVEDDSLKARLARLLGSPSESTALATGNLLWALLRRRLPRLLYHMGYGLVAGFLYAKNLTDALPEALLPLTATMGAEEKDRGGDEGRVSESSTNNPRGAAPFRMGQSVVRPGPYETDLSPLSSDEEALERAGGLTAIANWVTGEPIEKAIGANSSLDGDSSTERSMTEEEKEEETARLVNLLERWEDTQRGR